MTYNGFYVEYNTPERADFQRLFSSFFNFVKSKRNLPFIIYISLLKKNGVFIEKKPFFVYNNKLLIIRMEFFG